MLLQTVHFGHFEVGVDAAKRIDHIQDQGFRRGGFGGQAGQVTSLSGDTLVLRDRQGQTVKVKLTSSTTVRKSATGSLSDVKPGATVTVAGNPATSITILPATQ